MSHKLSKSAQNLTGQPMFRMLSKIQEIEKKGKKILHFELGDPDFPTPSNISEAAIKSIRDGKTHYANSMGISELREAVQKTTEISRGFKPDFSQVLVTPGANYIIYLAISTLVNPGEEVIIPDPGFPTYTSAANFIGAKPVYVPLYEKNNFQLSPDDLEKKITDKTKLIIINGLSKAFAMTGWRIGVAIGPEEIISKMGLIVETISSCTPPFCQYAGLEAVVGDQSALKKMKKEYEERKKILVEGLNEVKGISCVNPGGAMYVFPNITKTGMDSDTFSEYVLDKIGVGVLPGNNFGENGEGYIRMCYATSQEDILLALSRLKNLFG